MPLAQFMCCINLFISPIDIVTIQIMSSIWAQTLLSTNYQAKQYGIRNNAVCNCNPCCIKWCALMAKQFWLSMVCEKEQMVVAKMINQMCSPLDLWQSGKNVQTKQFHKWILIETVTQMEMDWCLYNQFTQCKNSCDPPNKLIMHLSHGSLNAQHKHLHFSIKLHPCITHTHHLSKLLAKPTHLATLRKMAISSMALWCFSF